MQPFDIAEYIHTNRKQRRLSMAELGRRSGISAPSIRAYEAGTRTPKQDKLNKIQAVFDATPPVEPLLDVERSFNLKIPDIVQMKPVKAKVVELSNDSYVYTWHDKVLSEKHLKAIRGVLDSIM